MNVVEMHALKYVLAIFAFVAVIQFFQTLRNLSLGYPVRRSFFIMLGAIAAAFVTFFPAFGF